MKIILKNKKVSNVEFQANKIFTDREVPRQSFWRTYEAYKDTLEVGEDIKVLTYYGIGGIGKTSLLHKLRDEMKEKIKKPLYAYIDLNISREPRAVLDSLRNMLSADYKFEFPLYDLAVYAYAKKIGEKINEETTEGLIGRSRFLSTVMDALSDIPIVGIVSKLDKCAGYVRDFIVHYKNETTDIGESTPEEIYKKLPYYFACDITDNLQATTEPLVIFLDTYETLVNEMSGTGEAIDNDLWIRGEDGLVMNSQRVLWVIAGREKLRWTDINDEWEESLDQHILGSLSKSDAFMFLKMSGINEENLLEAIYKLTNGTPVFLDLCVDNYSKIISLGHTPTIEDFSGSTNALISRYLKYMDDGLKDIVFLLSCVKTWNDSLFSNITEKTGANFSFTAYERIKSLSFITDDGNGTYTMHQTVQSVIFQKCPELLKNKTFIALAQYYEKKLDSVSLGSAVDTDLSMIFSKYVDSVLQIPYEKEEDFAKKYSELKGKINNFIKVSDIIRNMSKIIDFLERNFLDTAILAKVYLDYAEYLSSSLRDAIENTKKAIEIYQKLYGDKSKFVIHAKSELALRYTFFSEQEKACEILEQIFPLAISVFGIENSETEEIKNRLLMIYSMWEEVEKEINIQKIFFEKIQNKLGDNHKKTIEAMSYLAFYYEKSNRYNEALNLRRTVLKKIKFLIGNPYNYDDIIEPIDDLIRSCKKLGNEKEIFSLQQELIEFYKKILAERREKLGETHWSTLSAMENLKFALEDLGNNKEADLINEQIIEAHNQLLIEHYKSLGELSKENIEDFEHYERECRYSGYEQISLKLQKQIIEVRKNMLDEKSLVLGEEHSDTIEALLILERRYREFYCDTEALEVGKRLTKVFQHILEKNLKELGVTNPQTIKAMEDFESFCSQYNYNDENKLFLLKLHTQLLVEYQNTLDENHSNTIEIMEKIADDYENLGFYKRTLEMDLKILKQYRIVFGEADGKTSLIIRRIGELYECCGRKKSAVNFYEDALSKCIKALGAEHSCSVDTMIQLGTAYKNLGQYKKATELFRNAVKKIMKLSGNGLAKKSRISEAVFPLSQIYQKFGFHKEAIKLLEKLLKMYLKHRGGEFLRETPEVKMNLAESYDKIGKKDEAMKLNLELLESLENTIAGQRKVKYNSPKNLIDLAEIYSRLGRKQDAEKLNEELTVVLKGELDERIEKFGKKDISTITIMREFIEDYKKIGRGKEAEELSKQLSEILKEVWQ